jgi:hypothetical protein
LEDAIWRQGIHWLRKETPFGLIGIQGEHGRTAPSLGGAGLVPSVDHKSLKRGQQEGSEAPERRVCELQVPVRQ